MVVVAEFDADVQDVPQDVGPGLVAAMTETGC
jgi:hypothetical protein